MSLDNGSNMQKYFANMKSDNSIIKFFMDMINEPKSINELKLFAIGLSALTITCAVFYTAYYDEESLKSKFYIYTIFGIVPTIIGIVIASKMFSDPVDIYGMYFYGTILFILLITIYMFYRIMNPSSVKYISYMLYFVIALLIIVALAIIYRIFVRVIVNMRGFFGFVLRWLFLIPCLLISLLENVFDELKSAPRMVSTLFVIEILIILLYLYMPRITRSPKNAVLLLDKPIFLSKTQGIGRSDSLFMSPKDIQNPGKNEEQIRKQFAISMWVYINANTETYLKEMTILRYGFPNAESGNPKITYVKDAGSIVVYAGNNREKTSMAIPNQTWNQVVVSYNGMVVDIFLNGNLEKTVSLQTPPDYTTSDVIEVGEGNDDAGLNGAICNVVYHKTPISAFMVANSYNLNRYRNPPSYN